MRPYRSDEEALAQRRRVLERQLAEARSTGLPSAATA
jgi:hypothetical protein